LETEVRMSADPRHNSVPTENLFLETFSSSHHNELPVEVNHHHLQLRTASPLNFALGEDRQRVDRNNIEPDFGDEKTHVSCNLKYDNDYSRR